MRLTQGQYNQVVRGTNFGADIPTFVFKFATFRRTALSRYHEQDEREARRYLEEKLRPIFDTGSPQMVGHANSTLRLFDQYVEMASNSPFRYSGINVGANIQLGSHTIGARSPLIMSAGDRMVSRVVFWDTTPIDSHTAELIAIPHAHALLETLDPAQVDGVEVWNVRTPDMHFVTDEGAVSFDPEAEQLLDEFEDSIEEEDAA